MPASRIVLVGIPRMLRDLLDSILSAQADVEVVAEADGDEFVELARAARPAVAIVGAAVGDDEISRALREHAELRVISVSDERSARLLELQLRETDLGELSPESLLGPLWRREA